jgi:hypothetical protein
MTPPIHDHGSSADPHQGSALNPRPSGSASTALPSSDRTIIPYAPPSNSNEGWLRWSEQSPGFVLRGTYGGRFAGKWGECAKVTREDGTVAKFSLPAALARRTEGLPTGACVEIVYTGLEPGREPGMTYHSFEVGVDPTTIEGAGEADDTQIPF